MLKYLLLGFFIQFITSLDNTLTQIPIIATLTRRRKGRIAFALGSVLAVGVAVVAAFLFSNFLENLPYTDYIVAGLILFFAATIYFNIFKGHVTRKANERLRRPMSTERFLYLTGAGFVISFIMLVGDIVVLASLFLNNTPGEKIAAATGIGAATFLLVFFVVFSAQKLKGIPHKREIATISLILLAALVLLGVI